MATQQWLARSARQLRGLCQFLALACMVATLSPNAATAAKTKSTLPYSYYVTGTPYFETGNPTPIQALPTPAPSKVHALVLMGGGPDVDDAYRWMIQQAGITPRTGGRFVVIRTTGTDAYNPYFMYSDASNSTTRPASEGYVGGAYLGLSSAETLVLNNREAAEDPFVNAVVGSANAVWIAGGDQSTYLNFWKGTALNRTLNALMARHVPIGGTSAGANVLGQFVFSAMNGTVTSRQALSNPYNKYMRFDPYPFSGPSFLQTDSLTHIEALSNTFVDPHFDSRDRMGRLLAFTSRSTTACDGGYLSASQPYLARGIGIDVETALLIQTGANNSVTAQRVTNPSTTSSSAAHFLTLPVAPATCVDGDPLTVRGVQVQRLADSATSFNLNQWWMGLTQLNPYYVSVESGTQLPSVIDY